MDPGRPRGAQRPSRLCAARKSSPCLSVSPAWGRLPRQGTAASCDRPLVCFEAQSDERLRLFGRYQLAELSELMKVAADLDTDRLIDPADADRLKAACRDQFGDDIAGLGIIGRIEEH